MFRHPLIRIPVLVVLILIALDLAAGWYFSTIVIRPDNMEGRREAYARDRAAMERQAVSDGGGAFSVRTPDGIELAGLHFPGSPARDKGVVLVHGFNASILEYEELVPVWQCMGYDVFVYDLRNHGLSGGRYITCGVRESEDLGAVVTYARSVLAKRARLGVYGCSMGGATVLMYAGSGGACDFVVSDCPYTNFYEEAMFRLGADYGFVTSFLHPVVGRTANLFVRLRAGFDMRDASPIDRVADIRVPVLYFCTQADTYIPPEMTRRLFAATPKPRMLRFFPDGGHSQAFSLHPDAYEAELREFLAWPAGKPGKVR